MDNPLLVDAALVAIVILFAVLKAKKGLYKCIMPTVTFILAVIVTLILAPQIAKPVTKLVYPIAENKITQYVTNSGIDAEDLTDVVEKVRDVLPENIVGMLDAAGIGEALDGKISEVIGGVKTAAADSMYDMVGSVVKFIVGIVFFVIALIVLRLLSRLFDFTDNLKFIGFVDKVGGAALGACEALIAVYAVMWVARIFRIEQLTSLTDGTKLLSMIADFRF